MLDLPIFYKTLRVEKHKDVTDIHRITVVSPPMHGTGFLVQTLPSEGLWAGWMDWIPQNEFRTLLHVETVVSVQIVLLTFGVSSRRLYPLPTLKKVGNRVREQDSTGFVFIYTGISKIRLAAKIIYIPPIRNDKHRGKLSRMKSRVLIRGGEDDEEVIYATMIVLASRHIFIMCDGPSQFSRRPFQFHLIVTK